MVFCNKVKWDIGDLSERNLRMILVVEKMISVILEE